MSDARPYTVHPGTRLPLRDVDLAPADALRRAKLPADLFAREQASLDTESYFRLWRGIEAEGGGAGVTLALGTTISPEAFDTPIFAAFASPDLNTALARTAGYEPLIDPMTLDVDVGAAPPS